MLLRPPQPAPGAATRLRGVHVWERRQGRSVDGEAKATHSVGRGRRGQRRGPAAARWRRRLTTAERRRRALAQSGGCCYADPALRRQLPIIRAGLEVLLATRMYLVERAEHSTEGRRESARVDFVAATQCTQTRVPEVRGAGCGDFSQSTRSVIDVSIDPTTLTSLAGRRADSVDETVETNRQQSILEK